MSYLFCSGQDITNKGNTIHVFSGTRIYVTNGGYTNDNKLSTASEDPQLILVGSSSELNLSGNLVNNFSADLLDVGNSDGNVIFTGTGAHTISGTSTSPLFTLPNVTVNGSLTLVRDIVVKNKLTLFGSLNLGNSKIDLTPTFGGILSETSTNRIYTTGSGTVNYTVSTTPANVAVNLDGIGLGLAGSILGGAKIIRGHAQQITVADGSIFRYFDVQPNGGTVDNLRFYYFDVEIPGSINELDLQVYISTNGGGTWKKYGGILNTAANTIDVTGINITTNMRVTLAGKDCSSPPIVNLGLATQNFCTGASVTLDAGNLGSSFAWSTGAISQTISASAAGLYSVVVRNAKGCEGTGAVTLVERPVPVPAFTTGYTCPGQAVAFTNGSTITSPGTMTYAWDFGDPASTTDNSTSQDPFYTFPTDADYTVKLTVTSDYSCSKVLNKIVTVYPLPQVGFSFDNACLGQTTIFTNTSSISGGGGITYEWDFGDGNTSTQVSPTNAFPSISSFNTTLTATSNANCITVLSKQVDIHHTPIAEFSVNNVCENISVPITNNSSITAGTLSYQWDFGDATNSVGTVPVKSYLSGGTYSIVLTANSDFNCKNQITKSIDIYRNPVASFAVVDNCQDLVFSFANSSTSAQGTLSYDWDFDDTTTSTSINPSKSFIADGTYNVSLVATTSFGCTNTVVKPLIVFPVPQADFSVSNACQDVAFIFTNTSTVNTGSLTYQWDFGDATTSSTISPSKNYLTSGTYPVLLKATSDKGCASQKTKSVDVYALPVLNLGGTIVTCGTNYTLDALNPGSSYLWSTAATSKTLTVTSNGLYSITVTTPNGCSITDQVDITLNGDVTPNLGVDRTACGSVLLDAGYPGSTFIWSDGSSTQKINATSSGNYKVTITDQNGCVGSDDVNLIVNPVPQVNLGNDIIVCANVPVVLDAQNPGSTYLWSDNSKNRTLQPTTSGDYSVAVTNSFNCTGVDNVKVTINPMPVNTLPASPTICDKITLDAGNSGSTYVWTTNASSQKIIVTSSGSYGVTVTTPQNCTLQFTSNVIVNYSPPVNLGTDQSLCFGQSIVLDAGNTGDFYLWSDNSTAKTLRANVNGLYWVEVRRLNGCITKDSVQVTIYPEIVNQLKKNYQICVNEPRTLDATSPQAISYQWFSSSGFSSSSPSITISTPDKYWVLSKDELNCSEIDSVMVTTDVDPITARFLVASFVNVGDSVRFVQLSYPDPVSFNWDFADGILSSLSDPVHRYLRAGDFNSLLFIKDPNDCRDSKSKIITIRLLRQDGNEEVDLPFIELTKNNIYPNPTEAMLNLEVELNKEVQIQVVICSLEGKTIETHDVKIKNGVIELNVSSFAPGMYILKLIVDKDVRSSRFIKL
ncbi:MAG: PKD domain-containing protein [Cyclobacteriaceae bacterium]